MTSWAWASRTEPVDWMNIFQHTTTIDELHIIKNPLNIVKVNADIWVLQNLLDVFTTNRSQDRYSSFRFFRVIISTVCFRRTLVSASILAAKKCRSVDVTRCFFVYWKMRLLCVYGCRLKWVNVYIYTYIYIYVLFACVFIYSKKYCIIYVQCICMHLHLHHGLGGAVFPEIYNLHMFMYVLYSLRTLKIDMSPNFCTIFIYTQSWFFFSNHFCGASSRLRTVSQDFMVQCIRAWLMLCKQRPEDVAPATTAIVEVNSHAICWQEKQLWRRWRLRRLTATIQPGLSDLYVCIYIYLRMHIYICTRGDAACNVTTMASMFKNPFKRAELPLK